MSEFEYNFRDRVVINDLVNYILEYILFSIGSLILVNLIHNISLLTFTMKSLSKRYSLTGDTLVYL